MLLHQFGLFPIGGPSGPVVFVQYPVLPWIGLRHRRLRHGRDLRLAGASAVAGCCCCRRWRCWRRSWCCARSTSTATRRDWAPQPTFVQSAMAFMNVAEISAVAGLRPGDAGAGAAGPGGARRADHRRRLLGRGRDVRPGAVLLLRAAVDHGARVRHDRDGDPGQEPRRRTSSTSSTSSQPPPDFGGPLWTVYVCWILSLLAIYPLCRWFAGVKARRRDWWLSYL